MRGTPDKPITWVFEPESFAPAAKLTGDQQFAIITDHLGTPTAMLDADGRPVWSADIGIYGELLHVVGEKQACPFRWPGQYEDEETGLYYNRFRYYDPESGEFVSQDPIGLAGGVPSTATFQIRRLGQIRSALLRLADPRRLSYWARGMGRVKTAVRDLRKSGVDAKWYQAWGKNFPPPGVHMTPAQLDASLARNERWLQSKIKQGYQIFDIGPRIGRASPSPFYQLEQQVLRNTGYPSTHLPGY